MESIADTFSPLSADSEISICCLQYSSTEILSCYSTQHVLHTILVDNRSFMNVILLVIDDSGQVFVK